jgi:hypothetical protein
MEEPDDSSYEARLKKAFQMVTETGMSTNKAANLNGIPYTTLRRKLKKNVWWAEKAGRPTHMSATHENELSQWIRLSTKRGMSPSVMEVLYRAKHIFDSFYPDFSEFKDNLPSRTWLRLFLNRNPQLKLVRARYCDKAFSRVTRDSIWQWFRFVHIKR